MARLFQLTNCNLLMLQTLFFVASRCQEDLLTLDDVEDELSTCPRIKVQLHSTCSSKSLSCNGRCGSKLSINGNFVRTHCSCDALCQVYDDCCWDYFHRCDERHDETWQQLFNAKTVCWEGHALISSCHDNSDGPEDHTDENRDYREPVVSEDGLDLHFIHKRTYDSCNKEPRLLRNLTKWSISFQQSSIEEFVPDLQDFLITANPSDALKPHLYDEAPGSVIPRSCYAYSKLKCKVSEERCSIFKEINLVNITPLCEHLIFPDRISPTTTTLFPLTVSSTKSMVGYNNNPLVPTAFKCPMIAVTFRTENLQSFSLLIDFNRKLSEPEITFKGKYGWIGLYCPRQLLRKTSTARLTCNLGRKCDMGLISFHPDCTSPVSLSVSSESQSSFEAVAQTQRVTQEILTRHVEIEMSYLSNQTYLNAFGASGFTQKFRVLNYSLEHTGAPGLDLAKDLIKSFRQQNATSALSSVNNVTLCLYNIYGEHVCDDIFIHGMLASPVGQNISPESEDPVRREIMSPTPIAIANSGHLVNTILTGEHGVFWYMTIISYAVM